MTLADRLELALLEQGPLPACTLAPAVRKRKLEVLEVLHSDPRFVRTGKARASRWSVRQVSTVVETFTVDELAARWECDLELDPHQAAGFVAWFAEIGYLERVDGNGRLRVTDYGLELSAVLHDAADAWGWGRTGRD